LGEYIDELLTDLAYASLECEYAGNMNVCNICRGRFKRRLTGSKRRGYYRRSIKCLLPSGMTALDAARKCLAYQVYCVIISCLKSSVIGGGLDHKHARVISSYSKLSVCSIRLCLNYVIVGSVTDLFTLVAVCTKCDYDGKYSNNSSNDDNIHICIALSAFEVTE